MFRRLQRAAAAAIVLAFLSAASAAAGSLAVTLDVKNQIGSDIMVDAHLVGPPLKTLGTMKVRSNGRNALGYAAERGLRVVVNVRSAQGSADVLGSFEYDNDAKVVVLVVAASGNRVAIRRE